MLDALNMSTKCVSNQFTDPPFHTEKINFLLKVNKIQSLLDSLSQLHNAVWVAVLAVGQFTIVWEKRCRTCLVKRGGHCRRLEGLRLYMLWDQVMTWAGRRAIWSAAGRPCCGDCVRA